MPSITTSPTPKPLPTVPVLPRLSHPGWPTTIRDNPHFTYIQTDELERSVSTNGAAGEKFDVFAWSGGDIKRIWLKTEGFISSDPTARQGELSILSGKLVKPHFDFQSGIRFVPGLGTKPSRTYVVLGYQGLAPYNFDVEPSLFISQSGKVSARFTGSYDVPFTQRLILQPRIETNFALQKDEPVGIGTGFNDVDLGLRLRYEIRREIAPYVGVDWIQNFGQTHAFALKDGSDRARFPIVGGMRIWF